MKIYRPEVDGLRAIAITSVVLFHAWGEKFPGGYVGVDIFFVISGYLITSIVFDQASQDHFSFKTFYARRSRRILPALLGMTSLTTAFAVVLFIPEDLREYGKILIYTQIFGANFPLAVTPGYFHPSVQENPLLHMWSLAVEEQFYLLWPPLLLVMARFLTRQQIVLTTLALALVSLLAAEVLVHVWPRSTFFHLPTRGWELLVGALLALKIALKPTNRAVAETLCALGVFFMVVPVILYSKDTPFPGIFALAPVLGCALVIEGSSGVGTSVVKTLTFPPVIFVGLISYSLYLWHWPILAFASYVAVRPLMPEEKFLCIFLAFAISIVSWRWIEQPFHKQNSGNFLPSKGSLIGKHPKFAYAVMSASLLLIGCGSFFQETRGMPWRYSASVRGFLLQKPRAGLDPCLVRSGKGETTSLITCQFGTRNSREVILWGDSHAAAVLPLVVRTFGTGQMYVTHGCTPLKSTKFLATFPGTVDAQCSANNDFIISEILRVKPKFLFIAAKWDALEPFANSDTNHLLDDIMSRFLTEVTEGGTKVIMLLQVPKHKNETVPCLLRAAANGFLSCETSVSRIEAIEPQKNITNLLIKVAKGNSRVFLFDPFPLFCDTVRCFATLNNKLLYFDADHLSIVGATALIAPFMEAIPRAFRPSSMSSP